MIIPIGFGLLSITKLYTDSYCSICPYKNIHSRKPVMVQNIKLSDCLFEVVEEKSGVLTFPYYSNLGCSLEIDEEALTTSLE